MAAAAASLENIIEARQNLVPLPIGLSSISTCPGTRLSCVPPPYTTSFVTSGTATITTTITTVITTVYKTPVTLSATVTTPGSCFTYLIPTPQSNNDFCGPWTSKCGPTRRCTVTSTVTGMCVCVAIYDLFLFFGAFFGSQSVLS